MIRFDPISGLSCQMQLKRRHRHRVRFPDELYNDKIFSNFARIFFEDFLRFSLKKFKFFDKFSPPTNWKLISSKLNNQLHTILFIVPTFVGWQKTMKAAALDHATHSSINNKQIKIVLWWRSRTCCWKSGVNLTTLSGLLMGRINESVWGWWLCRCNFISFYLLWMAHWPTKLDKVLHFLTIQWR